MTENPAKSEMPTLFIPHGGGPCFFMDWDLMGGPKDTWDRTAAYLRSIAESLPERPKAIVVVSGHWEEDVFTASAVPHPSMIYDYSGFPAHTYELKYPAPGAPDVANRIVELLTEAGIPARTSSTRGFDHGVFIPLLVAFPDADIPVVPLSLTRDLDPEAHLKAGKALQRLREEGVLIIGSGMSYHNMHTFRTPAATQPSEAFDAWLTHAIAEDDPADRWHDLVKWADAPAARNAHPREEHLLPLMIAAGAGGDDKGERVFTDVAMKARLSAFQFG